MAGTIIVDTINSSVASTPPVFQANGTQIGTLCRAWVNFNGTGTVAIRASFNVSSITDVGVGQYTVNFTTALPDVNYAVTAGGGVNLAYTNSTSSTTTSAFIASAYPSTFAGGATFADASSMYVAIFR